MSTSSRRKRRRPKRPARSALIRSGSGLAESFGIEGRRRFYEETGAIRDVVENHLLQVVGFLAMEPPLTTYAESIRDAP